MADLPGGADFGTLVHAVLEAVDFGAADLETQLVQSCSRPWRGGPPPVGSTRSSSPRP